jgi:hypothetical protein
MPNIRDIQAYRIGGGKFPPILDLAQDGRYDQLTFYALYIQVKILCNRLHRSQILLHNISQGGENIIPHIEAAPWCFQEHGFTKLVRKGKLASVLRKYGLSSKLPNATSEMLYQHFLDEFYFCTNDEPSFPWYNAV